MKKLYTLLLASLFIVGCSNNRPEEATTSTSDQVETSEQSSQESRDNEKSETSSEKQNQEAFSFIPYDEVHVFKNAKRSTGTLDDEGIYRYDFLNEDDAVYESMSYQEVDDIYPVQEQEEIEVTLGTNFTIDGFNFNLGNLTENTLYKNILGTEKENQFPNNLANGKSGTGKLRLPSQIGEVMKPAEVNYTMINTEKREVSASDAKILHIGVGHYMKGLKNTQENLGARISYEGINLFITRTQFIENVKIKNPVFHDEKFYYRKEYSKDFKNASISYLLDAGSDQDIDTVQDNSYVTFTFQDEILTMIELKCDKSYVDLEVE